MKTIRILLITFLLACAFLVKAQDTGKRLDVYYFHRTSRCPTCLSIEENTRKLLESSFGSELKSGKLTFRAINLDEKGSDALAEKFQAFGSALHLNLVNGGKETDTDLTSFAFSYSRYQPDKFMEGLRKEISERLK
jgi:hypothetical protein